MERKYSIYKITSPSGKSYVGLTKMKVSDRWAQHAKKARYGYKHPFHSAIRKYGKESFKVEILFSGLSPEEACIKEIESIALIPKQLLYNLSPGGENDGMIGGKIFWAKVNSDPAYKAQYLKNLSEGVKNGKKHDYIHVSATAQQWRKDNPREAWKLSSRALRVANKANKKKFSHLPTEPERSLKERLLWKFKRGKMNGINVAKSWSKRNNEARKVIADKVSKTLKEKNKNLTPEEKMAMVSKARASIDRSVQGPAASKGIKKFWEELKKDPVKFRAHMDKKTAKMMNTRNANKNENL
jgi:hypothetical protein